MTRAEMTLANQKEGICWPATEKKWVIRLKHTEKAHH